MEIGLLQEEGHCQTEAFWPFLCEEPPKAILRLHSADTILSRLCTDLGEIDERDEQRRNARSTRKSRDKQPLTF